MANTPEIAVIGGGSFGTALANAIAHGGNPVYLWMRDAQRAQQCDKERENAHYLPGITLSDNVQVTSDLNGAMVNSDLVFISVPSISFRQVTQQIKPLLKASAHVVSTTKGIDRTDFTVMSQILEQELPTHAIGALSGPNFAKEMAAGEITGSVIASENSELIAAVQKVLGSSSFKVYSNDDRYGVELAGALKNIYAIIAGMADARDCGRNTMALLMTRALAEMGRFAHSLGANPMTFLGLAGVGDLILTCGSNMSRNYRLGYALASGKSFEKSVKEIGQVVEGVNTLRVVKQKADEMNIYMPLVSALYALLFEEQPVDSIIVQLMTSGRSEDVDFSAVAIKTD